MVTAIELPIITKIMYKLHLNKGITLFIKRKQLNIKDICNWLLVNYSSELQIKNNVILNAGDIITDNWNNFHTWINKGLLDNSLKGKPVKLSNGSAEEKAERNKQFKSVSNEILQLYNFIKKYDKFPNLGNLFNEFHTKNKSIRLYRKEYSDNPISVLVKSFEQDFQQLINENLVEQFKEFIITKYKD